MHRAHIRQHHLHVAAARAGRVPSMVDRPIGGGGGRERHPGDHPRAPPRAGLRAGLELSRGGRRDPKRTRTGRLQIAPLYVRRVPAATAQRLRLRGLRRRARRNPPADRRGHEQGRDPRGIPGEVGARRVDRPAESGRPPCDLHLPADGHRRRRGRARSDAKAMAPSRRRTSDQGGDRRVGLERLARRIRRTPRRRAEGPR